MDVSDAGLGRAVLVTATVIFTLLVFWVNAHPFIDEDLPIYKYIPDPQCILLACAIWGLFFVGGLMSFTFYHIYPYL